MKRLLMALMTLVLIVSGFIAPVHAAENVNLTISADETCEPGEEVTFTIKVEGLTDDTLKMVGFNLNIPNGMTFKEANVLADRDELGAFAAQFTNTATNPLFYSMFGGSKQWTGTVELLEVVVVVDANYEGKLTLSLDNVEAAVNDDSASVTTEPSKEITSVKPHQHTLETIDGTPATCTQPGLTDGQKCSVCGEIVVKQETIPATGHTADNGTVTLKPTCTKEGTKTFKCTVCGEVVKTEPIAATGHTADEGTVTLEPTCDKEGTKTYKCTECGEVVKTEPIPATGHSYGEDDKCTECGAEKPATPPADEEDKDDVSTETGDANLIAPLMSVMMLSAVALVILKKRENLVK